MAEYTYQSGVLNVGGQAYARTSVLQDSYERLRVLEVKAGAPESHLGKTVYGDDCQYLTRIGAETIRSVRKLMKNGALNNTMVDGKFAFGQRALSESGKILANSLNVAVEAYWDELKRRRPPAVPPELWEAAAMASAGRSMEGGVCSTIAYVTMGLLTQTAHDVIACLHYNGGSDHSYVLIRRPETHWFVVDPWVQSPRLCPWKWNYFGPDGGNHTYVLITEPTTDAWGVNISKERHEAAYSAAGQKGIVVPFARKIWGQETNALKEHCNVYLPVCGPTEWGEQVNRNFRVELLWA
jgi:hypothetical protein